MDGVAEPGAVDALGTIAQMLLIASRRWRARMTDRLSAIGQTDARIAALAEVHASGGLVQRELAARLGVEEPTVVRLVDALEAAGLVERRTSPTDRRLKVVRPTAKAEGVLAHARELVEDLQRELFAGIPAEELHVSARTLALLSGRLERD